MTQRLKSKTLKIWHNINEHGIAHTGCLMNNVGKINMSVIAQER